MLATRANFPLVLPASAALRARQGLGIDWTTWCERQADTDLKVDIKIFGDLTPDEVAAFTGLGGVETFLGGLGHDPYAPPSTAARHRMNV
jgi:hypothetical protein